MKKVLSILTLSLLVSVAFAEKVYDSLGIHFSVPIVIEKGSGKNYDLTTTMPSFAFGLDGLTMYSERFGLYSTMDIFFPIELKVTGKKDGEAFSGTAKRSDYNSLWGMVLLVGPAFAIVQNEKMLMTLSPGAHMLMLYTDTTRYTGVVFVLGIGASFQDSIHISDRLCVNLGCDVAFDFYSLGAKASGEKANEFVFSPKAGLGFKF